MKNIKNLAAIISFTLPLIIYSGCGDDGEDGGSDSQINTCFSVLQPEPEPCFDEDAVGMTSFVTDKTVEEVISEQEAMSGFVGELEFREIAREGFFAGPALPEMIDCLSVYAQSELVINDEGDWGMFRDSCWFSQFDLPDVDFSNEAVLAVIKDSIGFETDIVSVLEFSSRIVVIVRDREFIELPPSIHAGPFHIVSIPNIDAPLVFIRVEEVG